MPQKTAYATLTNDCSSGDAEPSCLLGSACRGDQHTVLLRQTCHDGCGVNWQSMLRTFPAQLLDAAARSWPDP